ncbi:WD_REPEATS_REGION domain-containing protein [Gammaproteobacteria bacterium]
MTHRWFSLLILVTGIVAWADEPPTQPLLRVEADAHTATINQLALTHDGHLLSVSDDKTARLWDSNTLNPVATVRVPIGPGAEGALYAAATSPTKDSAVVAGATAVSWDGAPALYAVDLKTARISGRLGGLPGGAIMALAYSENGRYLAIGTGARPLLRVYDLTTHLVVGTDTDYGDSLSAVLFLPDGRLATAALDGKIRLYSSNEFHLVASQTLPKRARPYRLAHSPSGDRLAVGTLERNVVSILSTSGLKPLAELSPPDKNKTGNFSSVVWSGDLVLGAGTYSDAAGHYWLYAWTNGGASWEVPVGNDTVTALLALPGQQVAFATAEATLGTVRTDTQKVYSRPRVSADFRDAYQGVFTVNADASLIDFGIVQGGKVPLRFDLMRRRLIAAPGPRADLLAPQVPKEARDWRNGRHPMLNGKPVALDENESARSIAGHHELVALGTDYSLRLLRSGTPAWKVGLASPAWAVNISGDGRYVLAALGDGTLRWYTTGNGSETLALFVTTDQRWILWTPEGYFDHSPNAEDLIGYHKNTGRAAAPEFVHSARLYRDFFRPELLARKWEGKDITPAMQYTGQAAEIVAQRIPPTVKLLEYCVQNDCHKFDTATNTSPLVVTQRDVALRVAVNDRGGGIGKLTLKRNHGTMTARGFARTAGVTAPANDPNRCMEEETRGFIRTPGAANTSASTTPVPASDAPKQCVAEKWVALEPGDNRIELSATDGKNTVDGEAAVVTIRLELPKAADAALTARSVAPKGPDLYLVSIGINRYNDSIRQNATDLLNAESDAQGIVDMMSLQKGTGLYQTVRVVGKPVIGGSPEAKPLLGTNATLKNIQAALDYVAEQAHPEDVVVLFLAGHGTNEPDEKLHPVYHFITYDTLITPTALLNSLDQKTLADLINKIKASRVSVLLDTCHSGKALDSGEDRSVGSLSSDTGRFMLAGTSSEQEALDGRLGPDGKGHGVFTSVVLDGLHSVADQNKDGFVDVRELSSYVEDRMPEEVSKVSPSHKQYPMTFLVGTKLREFRLSKTTP